MNITRNQLIIPKPTVRFKDRTCRVEATIENHSLWFESDDTELNPAPEAFASALLIAGLQRGQPLYIDAPLDPVWLDNSHQLIDLLNDWWKYPKLPITSRAESSSAVAKTETGLCFTGGVDSFYSLLSRQERPEYLIFVHGYDIPLADTVRMDSFAISLDEVASVKKITPLIIRTNLREHPIFKTTNWEHSHGGALAAIAHLLTTKIGKLVIPSSYTYSNFHPWGTSWKLDGYWSSSALTIIHDAASLWRADKLKTIADEPLVRQHLRVCWENRSPTGNCGVCEKCVRTMISLELAGELKRYTAFKLEESLVDLINKMPPIPRPNLTVYEMFSKRETYPELKSAIKRWVERSRPKPDRYWRLKQVCRWLQNRILGKNHE